MSKTQKRTIASLFEGELRLVEVERCGIPSEGITFKLHIENMVNDHVLAITVSIPNEVIDEYDLTIS